MLETKESCVQSYISNGYALFRMRGKSGLPMKWNETKHDMFLTALDFPDNIGVCLGEDDLIVDVDPRNFKEGDKPHKRLADDIGFDFKNTLIVQTGSGGLHIYLKKPSSIKTRKKHKDYQGIDFLTKGCYVVGCGSTHPETKKLYKTVKGQIGKLLSAPSALLEKLEPMDLATASSGDYDDDPQTMERYEWLLSKHDPAISGEGGDHLTFRVACHGRRLGLSPEKTLEGMLGKWNERCVPPWDPSELEVKVNNAYEYNDEPVGSSSPHADFEPVEKKLEEEVTEIVWQRTAKGDLQTNSIHNVANFFIHESHSPELFKLLRKNLLTGNVDFSRRPPWDLPDQPLTPWDDTDAILCRKHLSTNFSFNIPKTMVHEAAVSAASLNAFHPVKDYLNNLEWDGVPRVDNWLSAYLGAKDTKYERAVGRLMLVAAVTRIFNAGCKYESLVVLEGDQGVGKTRACAILGGQWYGDIVLDVHNKDTVDSMRLKWIIEVSEMEMSRRTDTQAMKSFLSRDVDTVRLAYERGSRDFPRQQIFVGTVNPDSEGYLKDTTGNRRYLPVVVHTIDQEKLIADRDQLWAEALVIMKSTKNPELYIKDPEISEEASKEVAKRRSIDPWAGSIQEWLDGSEVARDFATGDEIYKFALGGDGEKYDRTKRSRIASAMADLGWGKTRPHRLEGKLVRGYVRPDNLKPNLENL